MPGAVPGPTYGNQTAHVRMNHSAHARHPSIVLAVAATLATGAAHRAVPPTAGAPGRPTYAGVGYASVGTQPARERQGVVA